MSTFVTVQNRVYKEMVEKRTNTWQYSVDNVKDRVNEYYLQVCRGEVKSLINQKQIFQAGNLRFLKKAMGINLAPSTVTTDDITAGDTTIYCDTTNLSSATTEAPKYASINEQVVKYTWKTSTTITGCTGTILNMPSGAVVKQVYKVPDDFDRRIGLQYVVSTNIGTSNSSPYTNNYLEFRDQRGERPELRHYTILSDTFSTDGQYIFINGYNSSQDAFIFHYYQSVQALVDDDDEFLIPEDFAQKILWPLVAWDMLFKDEPVVASALLTKWYAELQNFYKKYASQDIKFRQKVQVAPMQQGRWYPQTQYIISR